MLFIAMVSVARTPQFWRLKNLIHELYSNIRTLVYMWWYDFFFFGKFILWSCLQGEWPKKGW